MMKQDLEAIRTLIESTIEETPEDFWAKVHPHLKHDMFALCALDMAYHDLHARKKGKKLHEIWDYSIERNPLTNYTIGIDSIDKMVAKMKEKPWPIYKIKVGTADDIAMVKALRENTNSIFRVDANAAWDVETALKLIPQLKELGVEFVEQPLAQQDWEGMEILYRESVLPLFADESCALEQDVEKCKDHFHGINIKLTKCSGITPALRMIKKASELDLKIMIGCMNESTIGSAAIAHLLPFIDHVDMDGPLLLEEDVATGIEYDNGKIIYGDHPGLGVVFQGKPMQKLN